MECPKCKRKHYIKDGIVKGRQRYLCKECGYRYTVASKSNVKSKETRRMALELYLERLGFRTIGRILKISYGTVYQWVKAWDLDMSLPKTEGVVDIVELDEMHSYVGSKKPLLGMDCC